MKYTIIVYRNNEYVGKINCVDWLEKFNEEEGENELLVKYSEDGEWEHQLWVLDNWDYSVDYRMKEARNG